MIVKDLLSIDFVDIINIKHDSETIALMRTLEYSTNKYSFKSSYDVHAVLELDVYYFTIKDNRLLVYV